MNEQKELALKQENLSERNRQIPTVAPVVDILENDDEILLFADMPGVSREDITVNIENGRLALSGVRKMSTAGAASWEEFGEVEYRRVFSVPQTINIGKVGAELKEGVLRLRLPKAEAAKPRQIEIKAS
ncbi:MAG: heat-shock protein [Desulfobacterales bacterium GWB2_56_26]|nr:MAG: heat-shock protein [Desulfobacterales bacterium GWB2_56_26]HBG19468.1 heat-shock protein [Desulfobulbaceae bacterium]